MSVHSFFAGAEALEDLEMTTVGHRHGVMLLCASKLCRELNIVREAVVEQIEDLEREGEVALKGLALKVVHAILHVLSSTKVVVLMALAALAAAFLEAIEDVSPGGHHGASSWQ